MRGNSFDTLQRRLAAVEAARGGSAAQQAADAATWWRIIASFAQPADVVARCHEIASSGRARFPRRHVCRVPFTVEAVDALLRDGET